MSPSLGNDGQCFGDIVHTDADVSPFAWWRVYSDPPLTIRTFFIMMREDCCPERDTFDLRVGNSTDTWTNDLCY